VRQQDQVVVAEDDLDLGAGQVQAQRPAGLGGDGDGRCVPKTSSKSCDQAVLVYQTSGVSLPSDAVPVEIDRFG
jgi:hypothetical protein